ncbi:MAG TPA: hypothetical protein QF873_02510 [Patescibacteria group bacterium]|nr:hypothetical protein [Patescibacteria group bacterium]
MSNDDGIQVAMDTYFPWNEWRNALLHFLNGIWADDYAVTCRPKIAFGQVTLRRSVDGKSYTCSGKDSDRRSAGIAITTKRDHFHETLRTDDAIAIEHALVRFVRNDDFRMLTLKMSTGELRFIKRAKRSELTIVGRGLKPLIVLPPRDLSVEEADSLDRMGHARVLRHLESRQAD